MMLRFKAWCLLALFCCSFSSVAANLSDIKVSNGSNEARVTLSFAGQPVYAFFPLHNPDRVVLDIRQSGIVQGLPLTFSGENIVKRIRSSTAKDSQSIRLVFELTQRGKTRAVTQRNGSHYNVVFTISGTQPSQASRQAAVSSVSPSR
ncbi:MAG TPA: N-acetylmuramoyl-L-alanine amidase AmiB, partial [Erwinia persicina]|nr:N-acetylmuramoyl-L-alanine amidase AmiB [Erwinia persicina]